MTKEKQEALGDKDAYVIKVLKLEALIDELQKDSGQQNKKSISKFIAFYPLSANPAEWSNTLKKFVGKLPMNCVSVFDHLLALKGLKVFHERLTSEYSL